MSKSVSIQIGICCRQVGILKHHRQQKAKPSKNKYLKTKKKKSNQKKSLFLKEASETQFCASILDFINTEFP